MANKKAAQKPKKVAAKPRAGRRPLKPNTISSSLISAWEQDPGNGNQPDGGKLIQLPVPNIGATTLPTSINIQRPPVPQLYVPGTPEFRYWNTAAALARGSALWSSLATGIKWHVGRILPVHLDAGTDLNAFYDRRALAFFHGAVAGRTVFSADSPDVVCHEQGHAVLDALKPQLWDAASIEADAFHESFGDMSAILCALQLQSVRIGVITETQGRIYGSSRLSRLAEQLGWAIRQTSPSSVESDCLRNAVNSFFYRNPNTLPTRAPSSALSSEPHSFSRVFTGAFFEGLAGMFQLHAGRNEGDLLQVAQAMGRILVIAVKNAAVVPSLYSQVATHMVQAASQLFPTINYKQALNSAFVRHGILALTASPLMNLTGSQGRGARRGASFAGTAPVTNLAMENAAASQEDLPTMSISVAEYGLGVDSIVVHSPEEPRHFGIAGAALAVGAVEPQSPEETAKAFLEQLLRTGKLKLAVDGRRRRAVMEVASPARSEDHDSHTHELQSDGDAYVLKRIRIACQHQ